MGEYYVNNMVYTLYKDIVYSKIKHGSFLSTAVFLYVYNSVLIVRIFSFAFEKLADFIINWNC